MTRKKKVGRPAVKAPKGVDIKQLRRDIVTANKRFSRLDTNSLAYQYVERHNKDNNILNRKNGQIQGFRGDLSNMSGRQIQSLAKKVSSFLSAESSSVRSEKKIRKRALKTLNDNVTGRHKFTEEEVTHIFNSAEYKQLINGGKYSSTEILEKIKRAHVVDKSADVSKFLNFLSNQDETTIELALYGGEPESLKNFK